MSGEQLLPGPSWPESAIERYQQPLRHYAARIVGDFDLACDVVQDTFLRLTTQDPAELDGHLAQWLYTVCRRRALDVLRKENRMELLSAPHDCASPAVNHTERLEQIDQANHVLAVLAHLPAQQQEVVRLKFQHGLSYREIAGVLELTTNHVGVLLHNALTTLRKRLNQDESPTPAHHHRASAQRSSP